MHFILSNLNNFFYKHDFVQAQQLQQHQSASINTQANTQAGVSAKTSTATAAVAANNTQVVSVCNYDNIFIQNVIQIFKICNIFSIKF